MSPKAIGPASLFPILIVMLIEGIVISLILRTGKIDGCKSIEKEGTFYIIFLPPFRRDPGQKS
jgi:hypothetical protein